MKRNFILPSETLNYVVHDCRLENIKYRNRNNIYDVSLLCLLLNKTKNSLNTFYDNYLSHPEEFNFKETIEKDSKLPSINLGTAGSNDIQNSLSNYNTIMTDLTEANLTDREKTKKPVPNKIIKENILNNNNSSYGNILWPYSICSTFNDDVICADTFDHRLLVFSREFIFKYQIGDKKGSNNSQFDEPVDLVLNEVGKLYVADKNNYRLQIFVEQKKFKDSKTSKLLTGNSGNSKSFKSGTEYTFKDSITLTDKPIKLASAPLAPIIAVSTENGFILIINEKNQIMSYIHVKKPYNLFDLKNFCLNESGDQLICLKSSENNMYLKFYKIEPTETSEDNNLTASSFTNTNKTLSQEKNTNHIENMKLFKKIKLETKYYPGICLTKSLWIKLSLDFQYIIIYDSVNSNLLEYDLNGKFSKILLKAEERLGNLLAIDFSGDRQHLVATEFEINTKKCLIKNFNSDIAKNKSAGLSNHEIALRSRSSAYIFKLKLYRYRDCECHRHMDPKTRNNLNKSAAFNKSLNTYSTESDSAIMNNFRFLDRK